MFRWTTTRSARKFFRSRLALVALFIIGVYFAIGTAVMVLGWTSYKYDPQQRVGMQNVPGFFLQESPEKRLEDVEILLDQVERALKKPNADEALQDLSMGQLQIAAMPHSQMQEVVDEGWKIYDALVVHEDLAEDPDLLAKLDELEGIAGSLFPPPAGWRKYLRRAEMLLGTDRQGRSIFFRCIYSIKIALQIGLVTALISVVIGAVLGAVAGFFGGWLDHVVTWLYTTFSSIPNIVLLVLIAYVFTGTDFEDPRAVEVFTWIDEHIPLFPVYIAFCATFWIGTCRVVRGESLKLKRLEFVEAATTVGLSRWTILWRHVLPNTTHLMLINFSLLFIGAIKSEVILTFLNLGVKGEPSWGLMITHSSSEVVTGFYWQICSATAFMFVLVLAFNILSDSLQDVFDPRHN